MQWSWKSTPFPSTHGPNLRSQYGLKIMPRQEFFHFLWMLVYLAPRQSKKARLRRVEQASLRWCAFQG